jgi:hypothetical protein
MNTYKMQFSTLDDYEAWASDAGERIDVIDIRNSSAGSSARPRKGNVVVKYRTDDRDLAPETRNTMLGLRIAVALVMFALILAVATGALNTTAPQAHLLKLDAPSSSN